MAKLMDRREVAERTMAFQFERPSEWTFKAGQFVKVTLIEPPETDAEGERAKLLHRECSSRAESNDHDTHAELGFQARLEDGSDS